MATDTSETDYYRILDLSPGVTIAEVERAWKKLVRIWHPDRNAHRVEEATRRTAAINDARDCLVSLLKQPAKQLNGAAREPVRRRPRADAPRSRAAPRDRERHSEQEEQARWRAQPEPEVAQGDRAFVVGHWYLHPEKGTFRVERLDKGDRVFVRFRNGDGKLFVASTLWKTCQSGKARDQAAGRTDAGRAQREAEERIRREIEERKRRGTERQQRQAEEARAKQEAAEQARRKAEARAKREAAEQARREAADRERQAAEERVRRRAAERAKHEQALRDEQDRVGRLREALAARLAEDTAERERRESESRAERERLASLTHRVNDPLAWSDDAFVTGHWYAGRDGVFEVLGQRAGDTEIRFPNGEERSVPTNRLWSEWQAYTAVRVANPPQPSQPPREDVVATARTLAHSEGLAAMALYLHSVGWVTLDRRANRGPLYIIPRAQRRKAVDQLLGDLKRGGARLLLARGGGGVTHGSPAWIVQ